MDRFFVLSTIIYLILIGTHTVEYNFNNPLSKQPGDYTDTSAVPNHDENICKSTGNFFDIEVAVSYVNDPVDMEGVVGMWVASRDTIMLRTDHGADIDTVAHEVSHMVDTMMERYKVQDNHYEAWLQGQWTRCVWEIVETDLMEAGKLKIYRFAS